MMNYSSAAIQNKYAIAIVALGSAAASIGYLAQRTSCGSFEMSTEVQADCKKVFEFMKEPETYYSLNQRKYQTVEINRTKSEIQYNLVDSYFGKEIVTNVVRKFNEDPYLLEIDFNMLGTHVKLYWTFSEIKPGTTKVSLFAEREGPWVSVLLLGLCKVELNKQMQNLVELFNKIEEINTSS
jgi:hypothetical protein